MQLLLLLFDVKIVSNAHFTWLSSILLTYLLKKELIKMEKTTYKFRDYKLEGGQGDFWLGVLYIYYI